MFLKKVSSDMIDAFVFKFMNSESKCPLEQKSKRKKCTVLSKTDDEIIIKFNSYLYSITDYEIKRFDNTNKTYKLSDCDTEHWLYFMSVVFGNDYKEYFMHINENNPGKINKFLCATASYKEFHIQKGI